MPTIRTDDGVNLYFEETGEGIPLLLVHEFAGDLRSYEPQMRHFGRCYRTIAFNARGYPPSDVPGDIAMYSQIRARDDIRDVLDGLGVERAHVVGISMGGFATLHFGMTYPERARSLVVGGAGYGSPRAVHARFAAEALAMADRIEREGMAAVGEDYLLGPTRVQHQAKDPRGWAELKAQFAEHSAPGSANTMRGVQGARPSLYDFEAQLRAMAVPTLIINGDEDEPCLDVSLFLKRAVPSAGLALLPRTGHALNLEEPGLFNLVVETFLHRVDAGRWGLRDPRSVTERILGTGNGET